MAYFQTKNLTLGNFWKVLQLKMLVYFMAIWSICCHLVYLLPFGLFAAIWSILCSFGILYGYVLYIFSVSVCCTKKNLATLVANVKILRFLFK
jgi:hypothetical protein